MLKVTELDRAAQLALGLNKIMPAEDVPLGAALDRVLAEDILSAEDVPSFDRSSMDGYALRAAETFGCSEGLPALFTLAFKVEMGERAGEIAPGETAYVPTGGELPQGADAVVMQEHTELFLSDVQVFSPVAPGQNVIFRGDDARAGSTVYTAGTRLCAKDIGALAAMGIVNVPVRRKPRVGIFSTGDELIRADIHKPGAVVRDVNGPALCAAVEEAIASPVNYGIVRDDDGLIEEALLRAAGECDIVLMSGGSSVGEKDAAHRIISRRGEVLLHGIAVKPGKPTLMGIVEGTPVFGLPGHPMAAYMMFHLIVRPLLFYMQGCTLSKRCERAELTVAVPSNHGREELVPVRLNAGRAEPVRGKSGLITTLSAAQGYIRVPRDTEGLSAGAQVTVQLF